MRRDEATLLDIDKSARSIQTFVRGLGKEAFLEDYKTQSAVLYQLVVIGEAVKRLSREFRDRYPQTPWSLIAGMRDHLISVGYDRAFDSKSVRREMSRATCSAIVALIG